MRALTAADPTTIAASLTETALAAAAPELVPGFRDHLARAMDVVSRRLLGSLYREGLVGEEWAGGRVFVPARDGGYVVAAARRHAFGRLEIVEPVPTDPIRLLRRLAGRRDDLRPVAMELADAAVNLAVAYARRPHPGRTTAASILDLADELDADEACVYLERLATEGHNLHPCGRTRLGWDVADVLAHDLESPGTSIGFAAVRHDVHSGDDVGRLLGEDAPAGYAVTPVHAWQLEHVIRRYPDLVADGTLVPLEARRPATPTAALRTLLLPAGGYLKVSLDIQVTSTRRTISVASARNGPVLSRLLAGLVDDPVLLMPEVAGAAMVAPGGRERDLAAILRSGLSGRLASGESPVPGSALYATSPVTGSTVVAELVDRYGRTRGVTARPAAALGFLTEYARLLLPPVLGLATRHGIGLEAHLQNCVPTFVGGVPHRLGLRDLAGMRVYPGRLGHPLTLWPGSVIVASDLETMLSKVAYTALQANLGEVVVRLVESHDLDEPTAWLAVRGIVDEVYDELRRDPELAGRAETDHTFLTAPTVPHKALLSMRLAAARGEGGDLYVPVENPLR